MKRRLSIQLPAFMLIRMVFNTTYRMVYPFLPIFSKALGVDISMLSLTITARSIIGAFGPFLGSLADRRGRKVGMLLGLSVYTVGVTLVVFFPTFIAFACALVLTTLGKYIFDPAMQAYLGDRVPYERRGFALAITEIGWSLSFIVGVPLSAFLIARFGWVSPFWMFLFFSGLMIGVISLIIRSDSRKANSQAGFIKNTREIFRYLPAILGLSIGIFASAANEVVNLVFGIWLEDSFGLKLLALGGASAVIGFAELGGESLVGVFTDRIGKVRSVGIGLIMNSLAAIVLIFLGKSISGALLGLFLFYITFEFTLVASIPMMTEIVPETRATLMAFNVAALSLGRAIGASVATPIYAFGLIASVLAAVFFNIIAFVVSRLLVRYHV
ncbi:MAG TPA: MFS transporter [Anaerolineae bacterium]|nr:MFS transporter [Anaerolineae bacterium]